jgi:hypothetical protein
MITYRINVVLEESTTVTFIAYHAPVPVNVHGATFFLVPVPARGLYPVGIPDPAKRSFRTHHRFVYHRFVYQKTSKLTRKRKMKHSKLIDHNRSRTIVTKASSGSNVSQRMCLFELVMEDKTCTVYSLRFGKRSHFGQGLSQTLRI